ncbi:MAG TPA: hypothetical protein VNO20_00880 [Solirubrobacterales bacterium]|nr:hypothetical protein [Solirubrobacterales bacterium]
MKQVRRRLSYANVMSSIAVFLVLGGATAIAAKKIGTNQLKGNSVTTGKIKKEAVSKAKIKKNAVDGSKVRDGSLTGVDVNVSTLPTVPSAASAQPVAFARVSAAGSLDAANSKNVGSVTHVGTALYCFSGLPFSPRGGQATVDFNESQFESTQFGLGDVKGTCPAGTQAFVFTQDDGPDPAGFFVVFYG